MSYYRYILVFVIYFNAVRIEINLEGNNVVINGKVHTGRDFLHIDQN